MVLKIGDIIETSDMVEKFYITKITSTRIYYDIYAPHKEVHPFDYDKYAFETYDWKPAKLKWY